MTDDKEAKFEVRHVTVDILLPRNEKDLQRRKKALDKQRAAEAMKKEEEAKRQAWLEIQALAADIIVAHALTELEGVSQAGKILCEARVYSDGVALAAKIAKLNN